MFCFVLSTPGMSLEIQRKGRANKEVLTSKRSKEESSEEGGLEMNERPRGWAQQILGKRGYTVLGRKVGW